MYTIDELAIVVGCCYLLVLFALAFSIYLFVRLDGHLTKHEKEKKENEIIDKTRSVVFDDLCEYFEHSGRSYHNESKFEKR